MVAPNLPKFRGMCQVNRATGTGDGAFEDFLQTDAAINRAWPRPERNAPVSATGEGRADGEN